MYEKESIVFMGINLFSRCLLYTSFGGWIRKSDNVPYVSQTYDEQRWAVAAHAAKRVIDMDMYCLLYTSQ